MECKVSHMCILCTNICTWNLSHVYLVYWHMYLEFVTCVSCVLTYVPGIWVVFLYLVLKDLVQMLDVNDTTQQQTFHTCLSLHWLESVILKLLSQHVNILHNTNQIKSKCFAFNIFECYKIGLSQKTIPYYHLLSLSMYNVLDFTWILYFAGGVCIINKNNMLHFFSDRKIICLPFLLFTVDMWSFQLFFICWMLHINCTLDHKIYHSSLKYYYTWKYF